MNTPKLEQCPQCGSDNISEYTYDDGNDVPFYSMSCEQCNTTGPSMRTPSDAMLHWNMGRIRGYQRCGGWVVTDKREYGAGVHNPMFALGD